MSKETVNRLAALPLALMWGVSLAAPASGQAALVVGSVRDRHGAPIAGASVTGINGQGNPSVTTDSSGTFALEADGVTAVRISCRYCNPATLAVRPGEPVVAIVARFEAVAEEGPSPADLANLPYAHVESSVSLRPFTLLRQSTLPYPGSQLSDRGLSPDNALLVDNRVPNYDVVLGLTPYDTIPAMYEQRANVAPASQAFRYGDQAGSGLVTLDPFGGDGADVGLFGGESVARVSAGGANGNGIAAGTYGNSQESRQRADGELVLPVNSGEAFSVTGGLAQGRTFGLPYEQLATNYTFGSAAFDDAQGPLDVHAQYVADRGAYAAQFYSPTTDVWSDSGITAGVRTRNAPVQAFLDVSSRLSSGTYDTKHGRYGELFGSFLTQNSLVAGVDADTPNLDVNAGVGIYGAGYSGGSKESQSLSYAHLATPSLAVTLFPDARWSLALSGSGSFALPTLWQQYGWNDDYLALAYNRASLYDGTLSYTDLSRVKVSFETAFQNVHGFTNGSIASDGVSLAWQIAPAFSLRAWTMLVTDKTVNSPQAPPLGNAPQPSVNALWATYENNGALRFDAIYRRDLLDNAPYYHLDADVSGPVTGRLRWYGGIEDRQRTTFLAVGLRLTGP